MRALVTRLRVRIVPQPPIPHPETLLARHSHPRAQPACARKTILRPRPLAVGAASHDAVRGHGCPAAARRPPGAGAAARDARAGPFNAIRRTRSPRPCRARWGIGWLPPAPGTAYTASCCASSARASPPPGCCGEAGRRQAAVRRGAVRALWPLSGAAAHWNRATLALIAPERSAPLRPRPPGSPLASNPR